MGAELVRRMMSGLQKMNWPQGEESTQLGAQTYDMALENADTFDGKNVDALKEALKTLQTGDSRPYALAGVSYVLVAASREKDGSYAPQGLQMAMKWLEKAQEDEPEQVEINFIEALIYIHAGELDNARMVLNYLLEQSPNLYHLNVTMAKFWAAQGDLDEMAQWYAQAGTLADTVPRRLRLLKRMGAAYMEAGRWAEAADNYEKSIHFNEQNGELRLRLAEAKWEMEEYEECLQLVEKALELGAPQKEAQALRKKVLTQLDPEAAAAEEKKGGFLGRLFGG